MGVNMAQKKEDMSRKALMLLVVAVLVVSLVGTWLVLQSSFESPTDSSRGVVSFSKTGGPIPPPVMRESHPVASGIVSFEKS
jgi:hypothetical protein